MKNIFITGGQGQDGRILIDLLKKKKVKLNIISKRNVKSIKNVNFIKSNLLNKKKIKKIFSKNKPDIVLHLASNNPSYNQDNYKLFYQENLIATKNIFLETFEANKRAKFITCSSSQIFKKRNGLVNENSKIIKSSFYTKFRIDSDKIMLKYKIQNKIKYTNVILFNHDSKFRNKKFIIPKIVDALINKKILFLENIFKQNIYADFSHAEDICRGLSKLMFSNINIDRLILSTNKEISLNDIILRTIKKNKLDINIVKLKKNKKKSLIGSNNLAKKILKWEPKKNIFQAVNEIYKLNKK
jgi:nucleoside-diphosphate-sugar epimerase